MRFLKKGLLENMKRKRWACGAKEQGQERRSFLLAGWWSEAAVRPTAHSHSKCGMRCSLGVDGILPEATGAAHHLPVPLQLVVHLREVLQYLGILGQDLQNHNTNRGGRSSASQFAMWTGMYGQHAALHSAAQHSATQHSTT